MTVHASAPGKLALLGEYAVLAGAPALAAAIDRRAEVRIEAIAGGICRLEAPDVDREGVGFTLSPRGSVQWRGGGEHAPLALFATVLEALARSDLRFGTFRASLRTHGFFDAGRKLGLGSSAALVVALASALRRHAGASDTPDASPLRLASLLALHAQVQGGGSGMDVAASLCGGLISFERASPAPRVERVPWPAGLQMLCLWTGRSAATGDLLRSVAAARARDPALYAGLIERMAGIACRGRDAALAGDTGKLVEAFDGYADALDAFGRACGIPIMSREHAQLRRLSGAAGVVYKPSGAGGGDVGLAFSTEPERLTRLRAAASRAGFAAVDLQLDPRGLELG